MAKEHIMAKELINREIYDYYRAHRTKVAKGIDQYKLWVKAVNGLMMTLKELVITNENGVYIEGFGYIRAEKTGHSKKRVSILRKKDRPFHTIKFTPFDLRMERYNFTTGRIHYDLNSDLEYKEKLEAIKHTIDLKKNRWIK